RRAVPMSDPNDPAAYPAQNAPVTGQRTNVLAIVALILGIVIPIGGIICGPIAMKQIDRTGESGRGMAKAGLIIGIILTVLWIIYVVFAIIAAIALANSGAQFDTSTM